MAVVATTLMDTDWRVQARANISSTNSGTVLIDISGLQGWVAGSKLALSKVFWSLGSGVVTLRWDGTGGGGATTEDAIVLNGGGTYGYTSGQPALLSNAVGTDAVTGDLTVVNASAAVGTIIVECTKMALDGSGWSA
jgi:hypothetical protein|tara:strand:+ start:698 stop:1108 length:411 start_codon:yes stop_codon:yes gene_type:complete